MVELSGARLYNCIQSSAWHLEEEYYDKNVK